MSVYEILLTGVVKDANDNLRSAYTQKATPFISVALLHYLVLKLASSMNVSVAPAFHRHTASVL